MVVAVQDPEMCCATNSLLYSCVNTVKPACCLHIECRFIYQMSEHPLIIEVKFTCEEMLLTTAYVHMGVRFSCTYGRIFTR